MNERIERMERREGDKKGGRHGGKKEEFLENITYLYIIASCEKSEL